MRLPGARTARQQVVALLTRSLSPLNRPSRLADSPLCDLEAVHQQAVTMRGYHYPRAHVVIGLVRRAYAITCAELGDTEEAKCLRVLADALEGVSRHESARRAGVSPREISWRWRAAVEIVVDGCLALSHGP